MVGLLVGQEDKKVTGNREKADLLFFASVLMQKEQLVHPVKSSTVGDRGKEAGQNRSGSGKRTPSCFE